MKMSRAWLFGCGLVLASLTGCTAKGESVSDEERAAIHEGMSYEELVAAIGGEPRVANGGSLPDGTEAATYVAPMESRPINLNLMFRDGKLNRIVEVGRN